MIRLTEILETLQHSKAEAYRKELIDLLGEPSYDTNEETGWFKPNVPKEYGSYTMMNTDLEKVYVVDEEIPHNFPADHIDFAYSTAKIKQWQQDEGAHVINPKMIADFAGVTGSIIIDPLKGTITARCGDLVANDKTIQFVKDVVEGKVEPSKDEYKKRILGE